MRLPPRPAGGRARLRALRLQPLLLVLLLAFLLAGPGSSAAPAEAAILVTPVERSLLVSAEASSSLETALDADLDAALGDGPYDERLAALAEAEAPDLVLPGFSSDAAASQRSRLDALGIEAHLAADARATARQAGAFGQAAGESFFDVELQLDPGRYRLEWSLALSSVGLGDAALALRLESLSGPGAPGLLVDRDLAGSGFEVDAFEWVVEAPAVLRLDAFTRVSVQGSGLDPGGLGIAELELGLLPVPEPSLWLLAGLGAGVLGRLRRSARLHAPEEFRTKSR